MDIEEAFTTKAIEDAGVDIGGTAEDQIRDTIQKVSNLSEIELEHEAENIAVLCFVAGRAYQVQFNDMTDELAIAFLQFLMETGSHQLALRFMQFLLAKGSS